MACGVQAEDNLAPGRFFDTQPLGADRHAAIGADFYECAHAPDIRPPRAARGRAHHRTVFFLGLIPGPLWSLAQFAMDFVGVVVRPQGVDVWIGNVDFVDLFTGEVGRQPALPVLVFAFDFSFGLGRGGVTQADVIELKGPAQLGEGVRVLRKEEAVVIDIKLKGATVSQEGGGKEVKISEQEFAFIEFGAGEQAAAVIEHVEHGESDLAAWEPTMRRSVELPEFADLGALPTTHGCQNSFCRNRVSQVIFNGPAAHLGAVQFEGMEPESFRSGKAVWAGR